MCWGPPTAPPAWASPGTPDKSELRALRCLPGAPAPREHRLGGSSPRPCSPVPALPPPRLAPQCPALPGAWAGGAAAVSPPPASPLPGSRVSSRAGLCWLLAPGSCFLLQLPAALAAPKPGSWLSGTACPKPAQGEPSWQAIRGKTWARGSGEGGPSVLPAAAMVLGSRLLRFMACGCPCVGLGSAMGAAPATRCMCWVAQQFAELSWGPLLVTAPLRAAGGSPAPPACLQPPSPALLPSPLDEPPALAWRVEAKGPPAGVKPAHPGSLPAREGSQLSANVPEPMHFAQS